MEPPQHVHLLMHLRQRRLLGAPERGQMPVAKALAPPDRDNFAAGAAQVAGVEEIVAVLRHYSGAGAGEPDATAVAEWAAKAAGRGASVLLGAGAEAGEHGMVQWSLR